MYLIRIIVDSHQVGYTFGPGVDVNWGDALKGKWGEAIKAIKVNQKLKITSGPNVHVVELNLKVSDPLKACLCNSML